MNETYILASIFVSILLAAFSSAAETSITACSKARIHKLKSSGNKRAKIVSDLRENKEELMSTLLIVNNACNVLSSSLATFVATTLFGDDGLLLATSIMTVLIVVFAEVLPKTYAFENAERVALGVAPILKFIMKILYPVNKVVGAIVSVTLTLFFLRKKSNRSAEVIVDELRGAIDLGHEEGVVKRDKRDMLGSILDLGETEVSAIMLHRKNVLMINAELPTKELIKTAIENKKYTRIPLWKDNQDNIIGVLNIKDLVSIIEEHIDFSRIHIKDYISEPWFIPDTTLLSDQLEAFRAKKNHFAIVIDEYGAIQGIVTLEDILEEIVGQIEDEHDISRANLREVGNGEYLIDGATNIRDINRSIGIELPDDEAATIAGFIIDLSRKIPERGETISYKNFEFEVIRKNAKQISLIKLAIKR